METGRDVARRTGREDEELYQGLKIHFEVGFREMVSGSALRVKPCRPAARAAILAVTPWWIVLQGTPVCQNTSFPLFHRCTN